MVHDFGKPIGSVQYMFRVHGSLHRSDRSPLTGQTGLIWGRSKFVLQDKCTVSRKRKMRYIPLLIQKKLKPMMRCRSAISKWMSVLRAQDRWFLINRSILLSRGRSWIMIMRLATVIQHQSTFNQGGVLQGWLYSKTKVAAPTCSGEEGPRVQEAEG